MKKVIAFIEALSERTSHPLAQRVFCAFVYGWFLLNVVLTFTDHPFIWGNDTVLLRYGATDGVLSNFFYSVMYDLDKFKPVYYLHILAALLSMLDKKWSFVPRSITWVTGLMLFYAGIPALNAAMLIMLLMAFYCIPVYTRSHSAFRVVLNNTAYWAAFIQIVLCYAFSAIFKLNGDQWLDGTAVYYTLNIERFSIDFVKEGWTQHIWFMKALSYFALAYQLAFPVVVWMKRKTWLLLIGVLFHLFIVFVMNLADFGFAMIFLYSLFLSELFLEKMFSKLKLRLS